MEKKSCSVDGCTNKYEAKGYCNKHYLLWKRWGTPTPSLELKQQERDRVNPKPKCLYCDDIAMGHKAKLCSHHMVRKTMGLPMDMPRKPHNLGNPGYTAMHDKVRKVRGNAKNHPCIDCGKQARHWSLRHDAIILRQTFGPNEGRLYSQNVNDYDARCSKCHDSYDREHDLTLNRKDQ